MENDIFSLSILFIVVAGLGFGVFTLMKTRSEQILSKWANENGYQILDLQPKVINRGPFFLSSKMQAIHRIIVQDAEGIQHSGWVKCGNFLQGVFSDEVEVKWD